MFADLNFGLLYHCNNVLIAGFIVFVTGCAPSIVASIDQAEDGELQSIDRSTLSPLTGCYFYNGEIPHCSNCTPPFFPFPVGLNDEPPGDFTYLGEEGREVKKNGQIEADSVCLRAAQEHSIRAVAYQQGKPIAKKHYKGKLRKDGYYILEDYTQGKIFWIPFIWRLTRGEPALAVGPDGELKTVEDQSSGIFIVIFPLFGSNYTERRHFQGVEGTRTNTKSNQPDS